MKHGLLLSALVLLSVSIPAFRCSPQTRLEDDPPYRRTVRRASLHQLLKMNGNLASGDADDDATPGTKDLPSALSESTPEAGGRREDQKTILTADTNQRSPYFDYNDQDQTISKNLPDVNVGEGVTNYANPYWSKQGPSYADPDLLAAVMTQADEAKYRFPGIHKKTNTESRKSPRNKSDNLDELFPPAFHELLNIPMHVDPSDLEKEPYLNLEPKFEAPKITGGYSSTKVTGQREANHEEGTRVYAPFRTSLKYRKPSADAVNRREEPYIEIGKNVGDGIQDDFYSRPAGRPPKTSLKFRTEATPTISSATEPKSRPPSEPHLSLRKYKETSKNTFVTTKPDDLYNFEKINLSARKPRPTYQSTYFESIQKGNTHLDSSKWPTDVPNSEQNVDPPQKKNVQDSKSVSNVKEIGKTFKPSKRDPFFGTTSSYPQLLPTSQNKTPLHPTTFRPKYHPPVTSYRQVYPSIKDRFDRYDSFQQYDRKDTLISSQSKQKGQEQFTSDSPFERHPSIDKHTYHQLKSINLGPSVPIFPPYFYEKVMKPTLPKARDFFQQPPTLTGDIYTARKKIQPNNPPARRRMQKHPNSRKRPSFLENFGFLRRSGNSGQNSKINSLKFGSSKHKLGSKGYLLTRGPIPQNAQKVTVIGPFKTPPIGAPVVLRRNPPLLGDSILPTEPSTKLIPPSPYKQLTSNKAKTREPSFKVINLPKEDGKIVTFDGGRTNVTVDVQREKLMENEIFGNLQDSRPKTFRKKIKLFPRLEKSDIIVGNSSAKNRKFIDASSTVVDVGATFNVSNTRRSSFVSYPGIRDEVSEAEKENLIAAKFQFPKIETVRRSGLERQIIPIPVPLMTQRGKQVPQLQRIILPHIPYKRSWLDTVPRRSDSVPEIRRGNSVSNNGAVKMSGSIYKPHTSQRSDGSGVLKNSQANNIIPLKPQVYEKPQSYQDVTVTDVNYGGWKVVGAPKVNPGSILGPVQSYIRENTPYIELRKPTKSNKTNSLHRKEVVEKERESSSPGKTQGENYLVANTSERKLGATILVKNSSNIPRDGADGIAKSFLVQPMA